MKQEFNSGRHFTWNLGIVLGLLVAVMAVYGGTLWIPLDSDTRFLTYQNRFVQDPGGLAEIWTSEFFGGTISKTGLAQVSGYYRPVTNSLFWLEYRLAGSTDWAYHLTQILVHWLNACLVFFLGYRLSGDRILGFFAGLLFAVHPIHAQGVTNVAARSDVLFFLFYASAMSIYSSGVFSENRLWRVWSLVLAVGLYLFSILSKEMGATLPLELLFLHLFFYYRYGTPLKTAWRTLPFWGAFGLYLVIRLGVLKIWPQELGYQETLPAYAVYLNLIKNYLIYVLRLLGPHGAEYPELFPTLLNVIDPTLRDPKIWVSLALVAGLWVLAFRIRMAWPFLAFSLVFFLITTFPLIGVNSISGTLSMDQILAQERWIYLPSMGFFFVIAWCITHGTRWAAGRDRRWGYAFGITILIGFVTLGWMASVHGPASMSRYAALKRYYLLPEKNLGPMDLANKRILQAMLVSLPIGKLDDAIALCREAKRLVPDSPIPAVALARSLYRTKEWEKVVMELEPWLQVDIDRARELSRTNFRIADDLQRTADGVALVLARAYSRLGRGKEAAETFCLALRRNADPKEVLRGLTLAYGLSGPARCVDAAQPIQCVKRQPPLEFPDWKLPLDLHSCGNWSARFTE